MNTTIIAKAIYKIMEEKLGCQFCEKYLSAQWDMMDFTFKHIEKNWQRLISKIKIIKKPQYTPISISNCPIYHELNNIKGDDKKALLAEGSWLNGKLTLCSNCPMRNIIRHEMTNTEYSFLDNPYYPSATLEKILFVLGEYNVGQHFRWNKLFVNDFRIDGAMSLSFMTNLPHIEKHKKKVVKELTSRFHEIFGHDVPIIFSKPLSALPHGHDRIPDELAKALSALNDELKTDEIEISEMDGNVIYVKMPLYSHESFQEEMGIRYSLSLYFSFSLRKNIETVLERPCLPKLPEDKYKLPKGVCD